MSAKNTRWFFPFVAYTSVWKEPYKWLSNQWHPYFWGKTWIIFRLDFQARNIVAVTKRNSQELALGIAQGKIINCLRSLPVDASWNNVKDPFEVAIFFGSNGNWCCPAIDAQISTKNKKA